MAVNLLELLKKELSGEVVTKAASILGESPTATQSALSAAAPAVLAALAQKASSPRGGDDLLGLIQQATSMIGSSGLASLLSSGDVRNVAQSGTSLVSMLLALSSRQ